MCNLYDSIKAACERSGITVSAMCLELGMSKSVMSDLKSGRKKSLSSATIARIADFLGVSADTILFGESGREQAPIAKPAPSSAKQELHKLIDSLTDEQCRKMSDIFDIIEKK